MNYRFTGSTGLPNTVNSMEEVKDGIALAARAVTETKGQLAMVDRADMTAILNVPTVGLMSAREMRLDFSS